MKNNAARSFAIATLNIIVVAGLTIGSAAAQKIRNTPVTSFIDGAGVQVDPSVPNYRIKSDGLGPYYDGVDGVSSIFEGSVYQDWELTSSEARKILIDFRDPVPGSGANPPFDVQYIPLRLIAKARLVNGDTIGSMKGVGSWLLSPLNLSFNLNRTSYRVVMNSLSVYPETNFVRVTCLGVVDPNNPETSQCNYWKMEPAVVQPDGQLKNNAKLTQVPKTPNGDAIELGNFYLSFLISFTNP